MSRRSLKVAVGGSPTSSPRLESSPSPDSPRAGGGRSSVSLPSPREYRHGARRTSAMSVGNSSMNAMPTLPPAAEGSGKASCLNVFPQNQEVKELVAVGDKVWTADRRTPNISIRNVETGVVEKELKPPNYKADNESKDKVKDHIFPWSIVHVKFPILDSLLSGGDGNSSDEEMPESPSHSPQFDRRASVTESPLGMPRSLSREGSIMRHGSINRKPSLRSSGSLRRPTSRSNLGSSGRRLPPASKHASHIKPDGKKYLDEVWVGYSNGSVRCFDAVNGHFVDEMKEQGGIYCLLQWGEHVYSGSNDWTIRKWDAKKKVVIGQFLPGESGHSNSVRAIVIADTLLASASDDFTIRLWDHSLVGMDSYNTTGRCVKVMHGHKASVLTLCWCEKRLWSGGEDATVMVWDIEAGVPVRTFTDTRHVVTRLVTLPKVHRVMCCSVDNVVRVYDARSLDLVSELAGHTGFVHSCTPVATELRYIVWSSSQDGTIRVWCVSGDGKPESTSKFCHDMDEGDDAQWVKWRLADAEAREAALTKELEDLRSRLTASTEDGEKNQNLVKQLQYENEQQGEELLELRRRLELLEKERDQDKQRISELNDDLRQKTEENNRLSRDLRQRTSEGSALAAASKDQLDTLADLRRQLEDLRRQLAAEQEAKEGLQAKDSELQRELDAERQRATDEQRKRQEEGAGFKHLIAELKAQLEDVTAERDAMAEESEKLKRMLDDMKKLLEDQREEVMRKLGNAESVSNLEKEAREAIRMERNLLKQEVDRQAEEILALKEALDRRGIACAALEGMASLAMTRAAIYEARALQAGAAEALHHDSSSKVAELKAQLARRGKEADRVPHLLSEIQENEQLMKSMKQELDSNRQKLREADEELERLRKELDGHLNLKRAATDLEGNLRNTTRQLEEAQRELARLNEKVAALEAENDRLTVKRQGLEKEVERLKRVEAQHKAALDDLRHAEGQLAETAGRLRQLEQEKDSALTSEGKTVAELQRLRQRVSDLEGEVEGLRARMREAEQERDALRNEKNMWEERMRQIQQEIDNKEARVARSEDVLASLRKENGELEEKLRQMKEREADLAAELAAREDARLRNEELRDRLQKLQGEVDSEHYSFILRSRTDFIQAVYDWLLCSAMSRRYAKKSDLNSPGCMDALISAVEGAYKRGHYILSNYVSELEKHHLGVSPTLYPPDPALQAMFRSQRQECVEFLKGDPAKANIPAITRVGVVVEGAGGEKGSKRSTSKEARSFTPPAALRKASQDAKKASRTHSPPVRSGSGGCPPAHQSSSTRRKRPSTPTSSASHSPPRHALDATYTSTAARAALSSSSPDMRFSNTFGGGNGIGNSSFGDRPSSPSIPTPTPSVRRGGSKKSGRSSSVK